MSTRVEDIVAELRDDLKRSKLGVLVIHGIGEQKPGGPLLNATEPLLRWFRSEFGEDNVELLSTDLEGDGREPANTTMRIQVNSKYDPKKKYTKAKPAPKPHYKTCVFAEAHWADAFKKPSYRELVSWAFLAIPNVIATQFARGATRLGMQASHINRYPGLVLAAIAHFFSLFLAVVIQVLIVLMLPLALLPGLGSWVMSAQRFLATIVGDSLVFVGSPIQQNAIVSKAHESLEWLSDRCNVVAIVAHSQGAAVGYNLIMSSLSEPQREKIKLFFTLGSGLGKLHDLQMNSTRGAHKLLGLLFVATTVFVVAMLPDFVSQISLPMDQKTGDVLAFFGPVIGGIVWLLLFVVIHMRSNEHRIELVGNFPIDSIRWVDRYARFDMVPAGPLLDRVPDPPVYSGIDERREKIKSYIAECKSVSNLDSLVRDHTSYWQNEDEFVPDVGHQLAIEMGQRAGTFDSSNEVACRRRWRLMWRNGLGQYAIGLFLLSVWIFKDLLPEWGGNILAILGVYWQKVPDWLYELPQLPITHVTKLLLGVSVLFVCFLVLYWALNLVWGWWNERDIHRSQFNDLDGGGWPFAMTLWAAIILPIILFLALPDTPSLALPFEGNLVALNSMKFLWSFTALVGLGGAVAINRVRKTNEFETFDRVLTYIPFAVILSLPLAFLWANNFSDTFLAASDASGGRKLISAGLIFVFFGLIAVLLVFLRSLGVWLDEWLLETSEKYGKKKAEQSESTIGWFGAALGLAALVVSTFVPQFLSWQALLFSILCLAATLAAINSSRRDVILLDVLTGSLLFYAIFLHGHLRNWWLT